MKHIYQPFNKFLIRTPTLPFKYISLLDVDFNNPIFQEAIYTASKELFLEMNKYLKNNANINEKAEKKLKDSINKYWKRMITRTTPFGLFSGISTGDIRNQDTKVILKNGVFKRIRLDMEIIFSLVDFLENDELIKNKILFYPNDTLYIVDKQIRFYERILENTHSFKYSISKVDYSIFLKKIIIFCGKGKNIEELTKFICQNYNEILLHEANDFILELIESKVIISELNPCLTSANILDEIIETLRIRKSKSPLLQKIEKLNYFIKDIDYNNSDVNTFINFESCLKEIGFKFNNKNIVQIDLYKETEESVLDSNLIKEITEAIELLTRIDNPTIKDEVLENFKKAFSERFEDKEVSLLFATDSDVGIGYPVSPNGSFYSNSLIKNTPNYKERSHTQKVVWNNWQKLLMEKLIDARSRNLKEIIISKEDFSSKINSVLYPTFFCSFEIVNNSYETLVKLNNFGGSSGALLMSRFSYMDKNIENLVKEIASKEQELSGEPILEILHVAIPRIANVLIRPQMRDYELLILGNSKLSEKFKIPLSDIMVSLKNNKLVLRSKSLNKTIKVANTNAFRHDLSTLPAFNLLCDLQYDNNYARYIPFGLNLNLNYTPRIRYKNIILEVATWCFQFKEVENLVINGLHSNFNLWRMKYKIPRYVLFCESDNELIFDFDDHNEISLFYDIVKKKGSFILKEILFNEDSNVVKDVNGDTYRNEFIIAFHR